MLPEIKWDTVTHVTVSHIRTFRGVEYKIRYRYFVLTIDGQIEDTITRNIRNPNKKCKSNGVHYTESGRFFRRAEKMFACSPELLALLRNNKPPFQKGNDR